MIKIWNRYCNFSFFVQLVVILCVLGAITDVALVAKDVASQGILLRLHIGFLILYLFQIVFIFLHEKYVFVLTVLQGFLALFTNADFLFVPILRTVGEMYYIFFTPSVEEIKIYKYVFISLAFTLQMFAAYALYVDVSFLQQAEKSLPADTKESAA